MKLQDIKTELIQLHSEMSCAGIDIVRPILYEKDDPNADYMVSPDYYSWYAAIGRYFKPKRIAEIGVRYGYSLYAMVTATGHEPQDMTLMGWDLETYLYTPGCTKVVQDMMRGKGYLKSSISKLDTFTVQSLDGCNEMDLFHVDGAHDYMHVKHDVKLALQSLRSGGVLIMDDCEFSKETGNAGREVLNAHGIEFVMLPTFRGHYLAIVP